MKTQPKIGDRGHQSPLSKNFRITKISTQNRKHLTNGSCWPTKSVTY